MYISLLLLCTTITRNFQKLPNYKFLGDVTRNDSQRRFLGQNSVAMLEQCYNHSKQCRTNVAMLCCDKSRRCESCLVTPLLWRECCTCSCSLFFTLRLTFTLLGASISHFLTIPIKFSGFSSNKIDLFCFFSLSVFHVNIDIKSKKIIGSVVVVYL